MTASRVMVVVAHPDDETFGCGSLLLAAADAGLTTAVVCATRGEAGEATDGTPAERIAAVREAETRAAARALGVDQLHFLDLVDSGMTGDAGPSTLAGAPLEQVSDLVAGHLTAFAPDVVVTLDGSDGHRDHAAIRNATLAAVDRTGPATARVYLHCLPQTLMRRWVEHMIAHDPSWEHLRHDVPGTPEADVTAIVDTTVQLQRREAAIAVHRSQRSPFEGLPDDLRRDFLTGEHLRQVRPLGNDHGPRAVVITEL